MSTLPDSGTKSILLNIEATIDWFGLGLEIAHAASDEQSRIIWNLARNIGDSAQTAHQIAYIAAEFSDAPDYARREVADFYADLSETIRGGGGGE